MGHYSVERVLLDTFVRTNLSGPIKAPNRPFTRPTLSSNLANPAHWWLYDIDYDEVEMRTGGRTRWVNGILYLERWYQTGSDTRLLAADMDLLEGLVDARTTGNFWFHAIQPGEFGTLLDESKSTPQWYGRVIELPYKRSSGIAVADIVTVAGVGSTSQAISATAHGLAVKDWVGLDGSTWRKVSATVGEPRCDGVVSLVPNADTFVLTALGAVTLTAHGYSAGPLYLSQGSAGLATSTAPTSGVSRQVATVYDANNLIVLSLPEVLL